MRAAIGKEYVKGAIRLVFPLSYNRCMVCFGLVLESTVFN